MVRRNDVTRIPSRTLILSSDTMIRPRLFLFGRCPLREVVHHNVLRSYPPTSRPWATAALGPAKTRSSSLWHMARIMCNVRSGGESSSQLCGRAKMPGWTHRTSPRAAALCSHLLSHCSVGARHIFCCSAVSKAEAIRLDALVFMRAHPSRIQKQTECEGLRVGRCTVEKMPRDPVYLSLQAQPDGLTARLTAGESRIGR